MGFYSTKITDYGFKQKVNIYEKPIAFGDDSAKPVSNRETYSNMCSEKQQEADERRLRYYKRKVAELTDIALMNTDLDTAITLTFRESVTSYDHALAEWQLFLKRLRYHCKKPLKYICIFEFQKERGKKAGLTDGGIYHFHAIFNTGFVEQKKLSQIWGNGFVWVDLIRSERQREKAIRYTLKYITKEITENAKTRGKRFIFTSNRLEKPCPILIEEKLSKDDIIFENLEEMIRDGEYDIKNSRGSKINHVEFVEYKT